MTAYSFEYSVSIFPPKFVFLWPRSLSPGAANSLRRGTHLRLDVDRERGNICLNANVGVCQGARKMYEALGSSGHTGQISTTLSWESGYGGLLREEVEEVVELAERLSSFVVAKFLPNL
jgi:hypothetical protein